MKFFQRQTLLVLAAVLLWRVALLVFTMQPIPANDAFGYDGAVIHFLHGGHYCNPSFALMFPISGREVYSGYPPLYEAGLLLWMKVFGTSLLAAMTFHLVLFAASAWLTLALVQRFFPPAGRSAWAALLLFGFTFGDRPESLAYVFGLASLWLVTRQIQAELGTPNLAPGSRVRAAALTFTLFLGLYTSTIVGAYFFGIGFLACAAAWWWRRRWSWFVPFAGATALFAVVTLAIIKLEPLWWAGFMESARQQSVSTSGFHRPHALDLIKLVRTAPVFLLGLGVLPLVLYRRQELIATPSAWLALSAGILLMGWILLGASVTLLAATYVSYVGFSQILLAAGLLAWCQQHCPHKLTWLQAGLAGCILLVSVRAIGISTWGVACAAKNSYASTRTILDAELAPFVHTNQPVLISSAYLYRAAELGVLNPVHGDWYFDHAHWTNGAQAAGLIRCQPPKLVVTQFDYYRGFAAVLAQLRERPDLVDVQVRNLAAVPPPDASDTFQRVIQHVSWAPVLVDLHWKSPPPP